VPRYYPIFNVADSAIVCGGILTVILAMRGYHLDGTRSVDEPVDERADPPAAASGDSAGAETEAAEPARPAEQ
jgi:signal peptidase II